MDYQFENTNEGQLQQLCYMWFVNNFPHMRELLQSIPNESKRSTGYANKLKSMGLTPGFPDMAFHFRKTSAFLEFKTGEGNLSDHQVNVIAKLRKQGFDVYVVRDLMSFQKAIECTFGSMIWRDLMRVNPDSRAVYGHLLPDAWSFDQLVNASGLGANPWEGIESESDIVKLKKSDAAVLASRLLIDSDGTKNEIVDRILIEYRKPTTTNEPSEPGEPSESETDAAVDAADAVDD
jgi:hypothetical protein